MKTLSKEIIEKYGIEIEGNLNYIHNSDGRQKSCIAFRGGFEVTEDRHTATIHCKNAVITLRKDVHSFHVTIF